MPIIHPLDEGCQFGPPLGSSTPSPIPNPNPPPLAMPGGVHHGLAAVGPIAGGGGWDGGFGPQAPPNPPELLTAAVNSVQSALDELKEQARGQVTPLKLTAWW